MTDFQFFTETLSGTFAIKQSLKMPHNSNACYTALSLTNGRKLACRMSWRNLAEKETPKVLSP